jgi:hypothetical protein
MQNKQKIKSKHISYLCFIQFVHPICRLETWLGKPLVTQNTGDEISRKEENPKTNN